MDSWSSPLRTIASPTERGALFPLLLLTLLFGKQGHGQAVWRSPAKFYGQFFNKSDGVLRAVKQGLVQPHSKVTDCVGKQISFADGSAAEIDQVILCTGYHRNFSFLPNYKTSVYQHYLFVFNNDDPSLALLGFARPAVTSIPFITEQQVRLVAKVFTEQVQLPDKDARTQEIAFDAATMAKRYCDTSRRADGLVDPMWYTRRISTVAGTFPRFDKLFFKHPLICLKLLRLPAHGALLMVNAAMDDKHRLKIIAAIMGRYRPRPNQARFYLDTCGGWLVVRLFEDLFRLWLRLTGQTHKYY